ncbi:hypothetical protein EDC96DRAFT_517276 [Choanephora cucurbitarum]|nr:hypothetical protein EDC96DRAFT_532620 [Choanephora cucurbitarum]KAI8353669.1 hypothetical protein EDC96DRAFT_517276 [Choanephora cucurbitarum]
MLPNEPIGDQSIQAITKKDQEEKIVVMSLPIKQAFLFLSLSLSFDTLFLLPILIAMPFFFGNNKECFLKASCRTREHVNMSSFILSLYFLFLYFCDSL